MKFTVLALSVALLVVASAPAASAEKSFLKKKDKWEKPEFCGKSECPRFEKGDKGEGWEERIYEGGKWAVTNVTDTKYELAYTRAAAKLMRYFKGSNSDKERMDLTTPTLGALRLSKDAGESERDYSFSMWLHPDFQDDTPEPNDEDVEIIDYPETTVYVRSFGGFATETTILNEVKALHEELSKDEIDFDEDMVFVAVYDPAVKLLNRHNEVHVMKEGEAPKAVAAS